MISEAGEEYPIVGGKPILVKLPRPHHLSVPAPEHISRNQRRYVVEERNASFPKRCLHLGSGNIPCLDPRVVSLDVLPCENVDLVAEAEELPFIDNVFDHVDSGAVFEHLREPLLAIEEVKRVTAPGGLNIIDTAFLQSYHGYPGHYFNLTPLAVESFLVDDFVLVDSHVPGSATPIKTWLDLTDRFLSFCSKEQRLRLKRLPLGELLEQFKNDALFCQKVLEPFSEYAHRALATSFVVAAQKPLRWQEERAAQRRKPDLKDEAQLARREYYELRMNVIAKHHEVLLYERLRREKSGPSDSAFPALPEAIRHILARGQPDDILSHGSVLLANERLRQEAQSLQILRDQWIGL
ncbi:MAG: methyltransferase domain-containing protein [Chthoniobacterales bacterium]